jgi:hypothetical protein
MADTPEHRPSLLLYRCQRCHGSWARSAKKSLATRLLIVEPAGRVREYRPTETLRVCGSAGAIPRPKVRAGDSLADTVEMRVMRYEEWRLSSMSASPNRVCS